MCNKIEYNSCTTKIFTQVGLRMLLPRPPAIEERRITPGAVPVSPPRVEAPRSTEARPLGGPRPDVDTERPPYADEMRRRVDCARGLAVEAGGFEGAPQGLRVAMLRLEGVEERGGNPGVGVVDREIGSGGGLPAIDRREEGRGTGIEVRVPPEMDMRRAARDPCRDSVLTGLSSAADSALRSRERRLSTITSSSLRREGRPFPFEMLTPRLFMRLSSLVRPGLMLGRGMLLTITLFRLVMLRTRSDRPFIPLMRLSDLRPSRTATGVDEPGATGGPRKERFSGVARMIGTGGGGEIGD